MFKSTKLFYSPHRKNGKKQNEHTNERKKKSRMKILLCTKCVCVYIGLFDRICFRSTVHIYTYNIYTGFWCLSIFGLAVLSAVIHIFSVFVCIYFLLALNTHAQFDSIFFPQYNTLHTEIHFLNNLLLYIDQMCNEKTLQINSPIQYENSIKYNF